MIDIIDEQYEVFSETISKGMNDKDAISFMNYYLKDYVDIAFNAENTLIEERISIFEFVRSI